MKPLFVGSFYWTEGEILYVRRLRVSNKVRLTLSGKVKPRYASYDPLLIPVQPYKNTVLACSRCGSVEYRPDTCPSPNPDLCSICGKIVPLTDGARAPHECMPRCALCAGPHVTGDRHWAQPPATNPIAPRILLGGFRVFPTRPNSGRTSGQEDCCGAGFARTGQTESALTWTQACCPEELVMVQPRPEMTSGERLGRWSLCVCALMIPLPTPPAPSTLTCELIEFRQLQAQEAALMQAVKALANPSSSANRTPSGQVPEAMDSAPSEQRDTAELLAPIEARLSSLEVRMASIVTTIDYPLSAALQTVLTAYRA
ncbi:hypothetical protein HPB50_010650 [Hyalomma asiaticum]|uniref:Uncharacterized protein n=1 Tax=Hyalomma asiaticum TaxID=266040 RepID=A0ACB7RQD2_HYAAI|nr:hypothetical protein HPB50_010650 [Hyalomma asiaticum]